MTAPFAPCIDGVAERRLNLFLDGELPGPQEQALFAHLASCRPCRAQMSAWMAFRRAVREEPLQVSPAADEAFLAKLSAVREAEADYLPPSVHRLQRAASRPPARRTTLRRVPVSVAALAACVLFVLGWFAGAPDTTDPLALQAPVNAAPIASGVVETVADDGGALYVMPGVTVQPSVTPTGVAPGRMQ